MRSPDEIKAAVQAGELSMHRLAKLSNVPYASVYNWVAGDASPNLRTIEKLERGYALHRKQKASALETKGATR